jgi:uncharacterized lipoprotein YmbA
MKYLLIVLVLLLTGCSTTVPVKQKFLLVPEQLLTNCKSLQLMDKDSSIVDATKVVVTNYTEYYQCSILVDTWQQWYREQKLIFEELR